VNAARPSQVQQAPPHQAGGPRIGRRAVGVPDALDGQLIHQLGEPLPAQPELLSSLPVSQSGPLGDTPGF